MAKQTAAQKKAKELANSKKQTPAPPKPPVPTDKGKEELPKEEKGTLDDLETNEPLDSKELKKDIEEAISKDNDTPVTLSGDKILKEDLEAIPVNAEEMEQFKGQDDSMLPQMGDDNLPPLELSAEDEEAILAKQAKDDEQRAINRSKTETYSNGSNEWKLIERTFNNTLDWEHTTKAMQIGTRGVLVHIKEAVGQKINSTSVYIDNGKLVETKGKWFLK